MIGLKALQGQVRYLVDDLRGQVAANGDLRSALRQEHAAAQQAERTAGTFESWLEDVLDQAAVAWVLGCIFVRFCEDNHLVEPLWIGGPEPGALVDQAVQHRQAYLIDHPRHNDRHWLREAFTYLAGVRATAKIFDEHNPVWRFDISGEAAEVLSDFFRRGAGFESLYRPDRNTRFLGDLYQDLSTHAKTTYALLQTPEFIEEFILDRTFEPAVAEFGLPATKVIDPTCGSGHFLLGTFHRLVEKWKKREPNGDIRVLVERALGQVTGVDINPFAVAIARFRLLIAAMKVCQHNSLETAPSFPVRVATGDSLLEWGSKSRAQGDLVELAEGGLVFAYASEDADLLMDYLETGQYTAVMGNPPYIAVADSARNKLYRRSYGTCAGKYALTAPFAERFFQLAIRGDSDGDGAGHVGQITGNGFMKREFGKRLIENFFGQKTIQTGPPIVSIELTEIIDTSSVYVPEHGTPTVILIGRNRLASPRYSSKIRTILGIKGELSTPAEPARGAVWLAIMDQIDRPGSESEWITAADLPRAQFASHPWSLSGGGAAGLMDVLNTTTQQKIATSAEAVGIVSVTGEDDLYLFPTPRAAKRVGAEQTTALVEGDSVRDFCIKRTSTALWPYLPNLEVLPIEEHGGSRKVFTIYRTSISRRKRFGTPMVDRGLTWWEWQELYRDKLRVPFSIAFAFVATHNHFVLDRGGKVFNRSAPVIKLPADATEDDHLKLIGVLNSSTTCFWLKQVSQAKSGSGIGRGIQPEDWMERYEFTGTKLEEFPLPAAYPLERTREIDGLAQRLAELTPSAVASDKTPSRQLLHDAKVDYGRVRAQMIALQEELDWEVYRLYGLLDEDLTSTAPPELRLGERAFEILMARNSVDTQWFARHGSTPITKLPEEWPDEYKALVERRIAAIEADRNIGLIERPECKRRWSTEGWDAMQSAALRDWLLDRLEAPGLWGTPPTPLSVAQLADRTRHDEDFRTVLDLWVGQEDHDLTVSLGRLVAEEHVPYLAAHRYKPSGLRKRAQWERTWALQRREDADETVTIQVPPKYASADFLRPSFWRARGKLDVPKERFISYPRMGRDGDGSELLGWAGWDHLAQAQALASVYLDRKAQAGWTAVRLLPLLAGLVELEPWLHQWHGEEQPGFPGTPAAFFTEFINGELSGLDSDRSALTRLRGVEELK